MIIGWWGSPDDRSQRCIAVHPRSGVVPAVRWADPPVNFISEKTEKTEMASPVVEKGKVPGDSWDLKTSNYWKQICWKQT